MTNYKWDMKSNYMLACTVCKYGLNPERWDSIAKDLALEMNTTPQICKAQFYFLCEQYGQNWQKESVDSLDNYVFSAIKRLYYGDLCERMTESRDLLMVMYDFIRLFKNGRLKPSDITDILQDVKNSPATDSSIQGSEREEKLKLLERLKSYMTRHLPQTAGHQDSLCPVELFPPPPLFQCQPIIKHRVSQEEPPMPTKSNNDNQVSSINNHIKFETDIKSSSSILSQSNNDFVKNETSLSNNNDSQSNESDIDEIERSLNNDNDNDDDDDDDRMESANELHVDESISSTHAVVEHDESTFMTIEKTETNESETLPLPPPPPPPPPPPVLIEISNSNDRDQYEHVSNTSISNQSTSDTRLSADDRVSPSMNEPSTLSNLHPNVNVNNSNDYFMLPIDQAQSVQDQFHHTVQNESISTISRRISVEDIDVVSMDNTEQDADEHTNTTIQNSNDNTSFVVEETTSDGHTSKTSVISKLNENDQSRNSTRKSRLTTGSSTSNYRKSIISVVNNLKAAKYGSDFAKPLKSFKLPEEYYVRIKKPLDIPDIRERMSNGDYDDNILLFERDILLMFTNALLMYNRELDIHGHAQFMLNYAMELFTSIENTRNPWKTNPVKTDGETLNGTPRNSEHDSDDNILNALSNIRTPSKQSPSSSSISVDSITKSVRRQITPSHPIPKRQRKTTH